MRKVLYNLNFILAVGLALSLFLGSGVSEAADQGGVSLANSSLPENLTTCLDDELGVKFQCDRTWQFQPVENAVLVVISGDPDVTLIVARMESPVRFLEQLTDSVLSKMQHYADGFSTEKAMVGQQKALKVKAFSKLFADRRLLDYYIIRDDKIYSLLFSISPKEKSDDYKFLFQDIVDSFQFVKS